MTGSRSREIITGILQESSQGIYLRELIEIFSRTSSDRIETKKSLNKVMQSINNNLIKTVLYVLRIKFSFITVIVIL